MTYEGRITGQRLIVQRDTQIGYSAIRGGFKCDLFVTPNWPKPTAPARSPSRPEVGVNIDHAAINITSGRIVPARPRPHRWRQHRARRQHAARPHRRRRGPPPGRCGRRQRHGHGAPSERRSFHVAVQRRQHRAHAAHPEPPGAMFQWTGGQLGTGSSSSSPFSNIGTINVAGTATKAILQPLTNTGTINSPAARSLLIRGPTLSTRPPARSTSAATTPCARASSGAAPTRTSSTAASS